ncbi:MAG TPA: GNAT family N-acetyltransferase [Pyrinomonadaceae bacterium]
MEIELKTGWVRSWQWKDRDSIVHHANNRNVWINLRDRFPHPYTVSDAKSWLESVIGRVPETNFAIASVDNEAVGGIGFILQPDVGYRSAEIGYWLGEDHWGRGLATEAVRAITDHAFAHHDICRIYAHVFEWNAASARVLEKVGYVFEGRLKKSVTKDGKTIDQLMYAITS